MSVTSRNYMEAITVSMKWAKPEEKVDASFFTDLRKVFVAYVTWPIIEGDGILLVID